MGLAIGSLCGAILLFWLTRHRKKAYAAYETMLKPKAHSHHNHDTGKNRQNQKPSAGRHWRWKTGAITDICYLPTYEYG